MTKEKKKKEKKEPAENGRIDPDPIMIPDDIEDDPCFDREPRASKFLDEKTGHPSEEWMVMNELVYTALDYAESMPFTTDVIRLLHRYYVAYKAGNTFDPSVLFDKLSSMKLDNRRKAFRRLMGEKLDEYLLAKKTTRK